MGAGEKENGSVNNVKDDELMDREEIITETRQSNKEEEGGMPAEYFIITVAEEEG